MKKTAVFLAALTLILFAGSTQAETPRPPEVVSTEAWVSEVVFPLEFQGDLRSLPPAPEWRPGDPMPVIPERLADNFPTERIEGWEDPVRQSAPEGAGFPGSLLLRVNLFPVGIGIPPDTVGAVGPNHYIGMMNASRFAIWDKNGGNLVPSTELNTLWLASGGPSDSQCTGGNGDPIVLFDDLADRWLMQEFDLDINYLCIYVSRGPDPVSDGWWVYDFQTPRTPDYPQYGVWPDAYYVTTFSGSTIGLHAFDRSEMLSGNPATFQGFTIPSLVGSSPRVTRALPADVDGTMPPPANEPGLFLRTVHATQDSVDPTTRIEIYRMEVDFDVPANTVLLQEADLTPAAFALLPCSADARSCIAQPGTSTKIDALYNRPMRRLQYRNFGTHDTLVTNQVVDAGGGVAGKRWWEFRRTPHPTAAASRSSKKAPIARIVTGGSWARPR